MNSLPILPPPNDAETAEEPAPLDGELDTVLLEAAPAAERPKTVPPPVPPVSVRPASLGPVSIRPVSGRPVAIETVPTATQPQYGGVRVSERADIRVDDLSLDIDHNPYTRSSLVPPPKQPAPVGAWLSGAAVGASVAVAVMLVLQTRGIGLAPVAPVVPAPAAVASVPVVAAAVPAAPAVPEVPAAPIPAEPAVAPVDVLAEAAPVAEPAPVASAAPEVVTEAKVEPKAESAKTEVAKSEAVVAEVKPKVVAATETTPESVPAAAESGKATEPAAAVAAAVSTESATPAPVEAPAEPSAPSELPETLSREDVMTGFEKLRADITACAAGNHGQVTAKATIAGTGRVTYAVIEGAFAGTPEGSCMALVVRKATFPSFAAPTLKVTYPFGL